MFWGPDNIKKMVYTPDGCVLGISPATSHSGIIKEYPDTEAFDMCRDALLHVRWDNPAGIVEHYLMYDTARPAITTVSLTDG